MIRHWTESPGASDRARPMCEVRGTFDSSGVILHVEVDGLRLEFWCLEELDVARAYFESPGGSTRRNAAGGDHWEFQPWQSRLPAGHNSARMRSRVLRALGEARTACALDPGYRPAIRADGE